MDENRSVVTKIRVVYKKNINREVLYVDAQFNYVNINTTYYNYSCNCNFKFKDLEEVADAVEEGYTVDEFTFE